MSEPRVGRHATVTITATTVRACPAGPTPQDKARLQLRDAAAPILDAAGRVGDHPTVCVTLDHVFVHVMGLPVQSEIWQHLQQVGRCTLQDLFSLDRTYFNRPLYYRTNVGFTESVPFGQTLMIKAFRAFNDTNLTYNGGHPIDYHGVTRQMFEAFLCSCHLVHDPSNVAASPPPQLTPSAIFHNVTDPNYNSDDSDNYRDIGNYPVLTADDQYLKWTRDFWLQAANDGMSDVLDHNYVPDSDDTGAVELFQYKKKFMSAVFGRAVRTDRGRSVCYPFVPKMDGQSMWRQLHHEYTNSAWAKIVIRQLYRDIVNTELTDDDTGTYVRFLDHYDGMIRDYNDLAPRLERLTDAMKCSLLRNMVSTASASDLFCVRASLIIQGKVMEDYSQLFDFYRVVFENVDLATVRSG